MSLKLLFFKVVPNHRLLCTGLCHLVNNLVRVIQRRRRTFNTLQILHKMNLLLLLHRCRQLLNLHKTNHISWTCKNYPFLQSKEINLLCTLLEHLLEFSAQSLLVFCRFLLNSASLQAIRISSEMYATLEKSARKKTVSSFRDLFKCRKGC